MYLCICDRSNILYYFYGRQNIVLQPLVSSCSGKSLPSEPWENLPFELLVEVAAGSSSLTSIASPEMDLHRATLHISVADFICRAGNRKQATLASLSYDREPRDLRILLVTHCLHDVPLPLPLMLPFHM